MLATQMISVTVHSFCHFLARPGRQHCPRQSASARVPHAMALRMQTQSPRALIASPEPPAATCPNSLLPVPLEARGDDTLPLQNSEITIITVFRQYIDKSPRPTADVCVVATKSNGENDKLSTLRKIQ